MEFLIEDVRRLLDDFDDFHPNLLKGIPFFY